MVMNISCKFERLVITRGSLAKKKDNVASRKGHKGEC